VSGELQRGPDFSVTFEVWERIEWTDGTLTDWRPIKTQAGDKPHTTLESARRRVAKLPTLYRGSVYAPGATVQYRIRQAITILEWLE
jgi:hypothetical protein